MKGSNFTEYRNEQTILQLVDIACYIDLIGI